MKMTNDLRKAAEMALEVLEITWATEGGFFDNRDKIMSATQTLRQALAQPEQEPFAYFSYYVDWNRWIEDNQAGGKPLYAAPPSIEAAVLAEREACAKLCEVEATVIVTNASEQYQEGRSMGATVCAAAIRARGEK
jgi:hypothetical protein